MGTKFELGAPDFRSDAFRTGQIDALLGDQARSLVEKVV